MSKQGQIDSPGTNHLTSVGKTPTGAQNQGSNIDVKNYADLDTGKGPKTTIGTEMNCPLGKIPTGKKDGGL